MSLGNLNRTKAMAVLAVIAFSFVATVYLEAAEEDDAYGNMDQFRYEDRLYILYKDVRDYYASMEQAKAEREAQEAAVAVAAAVVAGVMFAILIAVIRKTR